MFSFRIFFAATVVLLMLATISFIIVFASEEGAAVSDAATCLGSAVFTVLRFPTHVLLEHFVYKSGWLYFGGIVINCLMYSVFIERLVSVARRK